VSAFTVYRTYCGIVAHFTGSYNYIEANGATKQTYNSFKKRNDRHFFDRIYKKYRTNEYCAFFVANFAERKSWIGALVMDEDAHEIYQGWKGKMQNLTHHITSEMRGIKRFIDNKEMSKEELFRYDGKKLPIIMRLCMQNIISKETFLAMNRALHFVDYFDKVCGEDIIYKTHMDILKDYDLFLTFHEEDIKKELLIIFNGVSNKKLERYN